MILGIRTYSTGCLRSAERDPLAGRRRAGRERLKPSLWQRPPLCATSDYYLFGKLDLRTISSFE